jgi:PKHD-type hydroxylase
MATTDQILLFPGAVPPAFCEKIVQAGDALGVENSEIGFLRGQTQADQVRNSKVAFFQQAQVENRWLFEEVFGIIQHANSTNWNYQISGVEDLQYTVYGPGEYYGWHTDVNMPRRTADSQQVVRKLSLTIQLDLPDAYGGGDFEVRLAGSAKETRLDPIARTLGTVFIFPANVLHQVTMVTTGVRHSLVAWAEGPVVENESALLTPTA